MPRLRPRVAVQFVVTQGTEPLRNGRRAVRVHALHELQCPVREPVDDAETDGPVEMVRIRVLALLAGPDGEHPGGVELRRQRGRLARLGYEEHLVVSVLLTHLLQGVRDVFGHELGLVLKLHELVAAVAGDV